jgi:hypothetical protein
VPGYGTFSRRHFMMTAAPAGKRNVACDSSCDRHRCARKAHAEFLNAFNHTNWNVIDGYTAGSNNPAQYANINSSTFPALSDPYTPRNIQFRLQVAF